MYPPPHIHRDTCILLLTDVHEQLRSKLCDLYENDAIFDKFQCSFSGDAKWYVVCVCVCVCVCLSGSLSLSLSVCLCVCVCARALGVRTRVLQIVSGVHVMYITGSYCARARAHTHTHTSTHTHTLSLSLTHTLQAAYRLISQLPAHLRPHRQR